MKAAPPSRWHHSLLRLYLHYFTLALPSLLLVGSLTACSTQTISTTAFTQLTAETGKLNEDELLDVGVTVFEPGLDDIPSKREELTFADVRMAETQYAAYQLVQTLQSSGAWGTVRVIPNDQSNTDVAVHGTILQSDGQTMLVKVSVKDASGQQWYEKEYKEVVGKYSYDPRQRRTEDAFLGLYNRIANDMLAYRKKNLDRNGLLSIRTISRLLFARSFAPQAFDQYLTTSGRGQIKLNRLPSADDPMLKRIDTIRERDYLYVDALQEYYGNFARQMQGPYNDFRSRSYAEIIKYDKLKSEATRNMVLGVAAIVGGLYALGRNDANVNNVGLGALLGGGYLIKDSFNKKDEAQMQAQSLAELGNSMGAEIAPHTIDLDEHVVTLKGNVQEQYKQWREILADIYSTEIGDLSASAAKPAPKPGL
jgi:hypothetical protein